MSDYLNLSDRDDDADDTGPADTGAYLPPVSRQPAGAAARRASFTKAFSRSLFPGDDATDHEARRLAADYFSDLAND